MNKKILILIITILALIAISVSVFFVLQKDTSPKDCGCPPTDNPVCGVDEKTYTNECWAKCDEVEVDYKGECAGALGIHEDYEETDHTDSGDCGCPHSDTPVCGADEKTYTNECWAKCHDVEIDHKGQCLSKFGIHGSYGRTDHTNNLRSSTRTMFKYSHFESWGINNSINKLDNQYLNNNYGMVVSFVSDKERPDHRYYLLDESSLNEWKSIVRHVVERYDGDSDFGCVIDSDKDCYEKGDDLYPSKELRDKILKRPIKHWQIENEWLWQIYDKETNKRADVEDLLTHMAKISREIKKVDPDSKIIMSGFTGLETILLYLQREEFIEKGIPDCEYEKKYYENLTPLEKQRAEEMYDKTLYLIKNGADYYDIIDFHFYENEPKLMVSFAKFLDDVLKEYDLIDKEYWSLEAASPFYFFNLIGDYQVLPPCRDDICETGYYNTVYDEKIHSEHLIKMYMFGLSSGVKKIFYSTLVPTCNWSENFVRLSLLDIDDNKKLPYYTYKKMTETLEGSNWSNIEIIQESDDVYVFKFTNKETNKPTWVAWNDNTNSQTITLNVGDIKSVKITEAVPKYETGKEVTDYNTAFNTEVKNVNNNQISITLKDVPVFIEKES